MPHRTTSNPVDSLAPERHFLRAMLARATTGTQGEAQALIYDRYRWVQDQVSKALVSDINQDTLKPTDAAQAFLDRVWEKSIFAAPGWKHVNFHTTFQAISDTATSYWTAQHNPAPVSTVSLVGDSLPPLKVAALMVFTNEVLKAPTELAESRLEADILYALTAELNSAALDPGNAGIAGAMPASLTNGATSVAATADPSADISNLVAAFSGDWEAAIFASDPWTLAQLSNARDTNGAHLFPDVGPRGGHIRGVPTYATRLSPVDSSGGNLILIDPTGCVVAMDQIELRKSKEADILMADEIDSNGPDRGVNMFQTDATALKGVLRTNWKRQRAGSVAYIAGISW